MGMLRIVLVLICTIIFKSNHAQTDSLLNPGKSQTIHLQAGAVLNFNLPLQKGQTAIVNIEQLSIGIGYGLYAPSGKLFRFEDLNKVGQTEVIHVFAEESGNYRIQLFWDYDRPQEGDIQVKWVALANTPPTASTKANLLLNAWYPPNEPGMAIAVLQNNKVIFQQARGMASLEHKVPVNASTLFELASVSKQFTGYAMACLIAEGKIKLKDPIGTYLPELPPYKDSVTVEQLIYHTSGIQDWDDILYYMGRQPGDVLTTPMIMDMAKRSPDLLFTPGERFSYSNTNYNLLAYIIERVTGQSFATCMKQKVFTAAGMTTAVVRDADETLVPQKAFAYKATATGFQQAPDHISAIGSTSVQASMNDMVRWVQFLESPYLFPNGVSQLLKRKTVLNNGDTLHGYAFGNGFEMKDGRSFIQHLGSVSAYRTIVARYPKQQLAIIYLANNHNDAAFVRASTLAGIFMGLKDEKTFDPVEFPDLNASLSATKPFGPVVTESNIQPYAGSYLNDQLESLFTITAEGKKLTAINTRKDSIYLREADKDLFVSNSPVMPHTFHFVKDASGQIIGFILKGSEKDVFFRKLR
jgi:CubicO group peptidase (beta-lactamase class C family)